MVHDATCTCLHVLVDDAMQVQSLQIESGRFLRLLLHL